MEFMLQPHEVMSNAVMPPSDTPVAHVVEEEVAAAIKIGGDQSNLQQPQVPQQQQQQEQPIYFSDGVLYPSELTQQSNVQTNTDQTVALPDNLTEIYDNLGILGKLLTGGSIVTIRFLQAFRTLGESLVDVLGITKPKYEYELNLARQMQEQEEARKQKLDQLYAPWQPPPMQSANEQPAAAVPVNTVVNMDTNVVQPENPVAPPPPMTVPVQYQYHQMPPPPPTVSQMSPAPTIPMPSQPYMSSVIPPQAPPVYPPQVPSVYPPQVPSVYPSQ